MHLLRRRARGRQHRGGIRQVRRQSPRRRQAADVRGDVLDQIALGRRRRDHRPDLQGTGDEARLRLRRMGLEDRVPRRNRGVTRRKPRTRPLARSTPDQTGAGPLPAVAGRGAGKRGSGMTTLVARLGLMLAALLFAGLLTLAPPALAQQPSSVNPTASSVKEDKLLQQLRRIEGRGSIPDAKSYVVEQPAGRDWRQFHEVTLRWIGAIAILGMLVLLVV